MAKRRRAPARQPEISRAAVAAVQRRNTSRRPAPPTPKRPNTAALAIGGAIALIAGLIVVAFVLGWFPGSGPAASASTQAIASRGTGPFEPPTATPLASPPAQPAGDGTTVTIETKLGNIVIALYNESAPVAAQNFINLADAGFYNTLVFHRIIPSFVIQGGDPKGDGSGGPGYNIPDEPVVGTYGRGIVAMARTGAPNSAGSQFFIVLDDSARAALESANTYVIFGTVTSGMAVADQIAAGPSSGGEAGTALDPVAMDRVTVQRP